MTKSDNNSRLGLIILNCVVMVNNISYIIFKFNSKKTKWFYNNKNKKLLILFQLDIIYNDYSFKLNQIYLDKTRQLSHNLHFILYFYEFFTKFYIKKFFCYD